MVNHKSGEPLTVDARYTEILVDIPSTPSDPFWMLTRLGVLDPIDLTEAEREEAAAAGITDFDDIGVGLFYNRVDDAKTVAESMAKRFGECVGVVAGHTDRPDMVAIYGIDAEALRTAGVI